jgi:hypothetical protein
MSIPLLRKGACMQSLAAWRWLAVTSLCLLAANPGTIAAAASRPASARGTAAVQLAYATPQAAVDDLVAAVRTADFTRLSRILGAGSRPLIRSGDSVADAHARARFVAAYEARASIELDGVDRAALVIGANDWPFPVPLLRSARGWSFDTPSGARELLERRVGRNELSAIQVSLAYVDAQREYAASAHGDAGGHQYARKFASSPGRKDGLYWPSPEGAPPSPLGPLVAKARAQGYDKQPYHGYYYRILTSQGEHARGGAYDYVVKGRMLGGFGLVAYPAQWGASGVMTFIVNHDGIVYESNLGPRTAALARAMTRFDPGPGWREVQP